MSETHFEIPFTPIAVLAFHPVRYSEPTVRIHPLICRWLSADFDGGQVAVYLPLTEEAQREAADKLSVAGHIRRDPSLIRTLSPQKEFIWGLGSLTLTEQGRLQIKEQTGIDLPSPVEINTQVTLEGIMVDWLAEQGLERALESIEKLRELGEDAVKKSGASISPFIGERMDWIAPPKSNDPQHWRKYISQLTEQFASFDDFADPQLGVHLMTMKTRSRPPQLHGLIRLFANRDPLSDLDSRLFVGLAAE